MPKKKALLMIFPLSPIAEEFRGLLSAEYEILITDDEKDGLQILNRMREKISWAFFFSDGQPKRALCGDSGHRDCAAYADGG